MLKHVIAIDIGASSGRVMVGQFDGKHIGLEEYHRFTNQLVTIDGHDCWDIDGLFEQIVKGIQKIFDAGIQPTCIGIDTWGVDYVLLNGQGERIGNAVSYRDARTAGAMQTCFDSILPQPELYQLTGIQFLGFNTLYQLFAMPKDNLEQVTDLLLIPDYLNFRLTGVRHCDYTNASTTQLLDCQTRQWDKTLLNKLGLPESWFLSPQQPNQIIGEYHSVAVASIASHDTASAVIGAPLQSPNTAYLCSGTWSLMGFESELPVISQQSLQANITNEGGAEGQYRILKNIMGMWLIQCVQKQHPEYSFAEMAAMAEQSPAFAFIIDPDADVFLNPEDMQQSIIDFCEQSGQGTPQALAQIVRCIYDSLALRYAKVFTELNQLSHQPLTSIHVVGGGANNHFLNQLCADVCGVPVYANPSEASALGNIVGQLIATGEIESVQQGRNIIADSFDINTFTANPLHNLDALTARFETLTK